MRTPNEELVRQAESVRERAYAPFSNYRVGAAILSQSGSVYVGCNVEFGNYSNTIHAEEAAIIAAIANGDREFEAIAVVTRGGDPAWPCGMCRQSLYELGGPTLRVIASNGEVCEELEMAELLPHGFRLEEHQE